MFTDQSLTFSSYTTPVAVTATADSSVVDLTGAGVGNAPAMTNNLAGLGNSIGLDIGAGDGAAMPSVNVVVGATFATLTSLTIAIKAAPQTSSTVNTEGTYTTLFTSNAIPVANLVAGAVFNFPIPPIVLAELEALPRFYKLTYTVAGSNATAGTVSAGIQLSQPNIGTYGNLGQQYPKDYSAKPGV